MSAEGTPEASAILDDERLRLIPSLSTRSQLEQLEQLNANAARKWAMGRNVLGRGDLFSEGFTRELHRRMFNGVWRHAGNYRTEERSPGWEPARISEGVKLFLDDAEGWVRYSTYSVHETAVRLHHRLATLHPWWNGNGRHARLLADVIVAAHDEAPLTWGSRLASAPSGTARTRYLDAIRTADAGNVAELLAFATG